MKLIPIDPSEISAKSVFQVTCYICMSPLFISDVECVDDVVRKAGGIGWHGCETDTEKFTTVCPGCIKELQLEAL
jgi:uncharacterized Fe-S cluster-containing MiaB family protein